MPGRLAGFGVLLAVVAVLVIGLIGRSPSTGTRACVDPGPTQSDLREYDRAVGRRVNCVVLFDNVATTWSQWDDPWFISDRNPDENWSAFARARHTVVLTVEMFPAELDSSNWRAAGAAGAYDLYARRLARNLVAAGMGSAIIRLGHEANGTWYADNVGTTTAEETEWKEFWARTAQTMRSVRGGHFSFDWCVSAGIRPIALSAYYPGNAVVDSIGFDVYDSGIPSGVRGRWEYLYDQPQGIGAIVRFAHHHHKPLAVPEWGLQPTDVTGGGGSDPSFVRGIARLLRVQHVSFQAYFFQAGGRTALLSSPASMQIYRREILR